MGNESSLLKRVDRDVKYDSQCTHRIHCEGLLTDESIASVFVYVNDEFFPFAENCAAVSLPHLITTSNQCFNYFK